MLDHTLAELSRLLRERKLSSEELVTAAIERSSPFPSAMA